MRKPVLTLTKKDFIFQPYKGSGKGGQHRNKTMSCCRIVHPPSGVTTQAEESRDFHQNRKIAFKRMGNHPVFRAWLELKIKEMDDKKSIEEKVDEMLETDNLKVEVREGGKWKEE